MAKAHVLTRSGPNARVAFHISVPAAGNNAAGIQWRTALKNSGLVNATVLAAGNGSGGTISTAEGNDVVNGVVYEVVGDLPIPDGISAAQADAFLDAHHAALQSEVQASLTTRLQYFGYTRA